ncbi:MAG: carboxypeptidase regulatory-like domain-containing protein [Acidobacteriota bacterium]
MITRKFYIQLSLLTLIFLCAQIFTYAQKGSGSGSGTVTRTTVAPPPPPRPYQQEDDTKGSVVRGRVVYQNTGKPLRRGWIGFYKIRELVEPPKDAAGKIMTVARSYGTEKYVLTNDEGEFVMKGVKAGIYLPVVKVAGILNSDFSDVENPNFQQIAVDGVSEIQTNIGIQRGGAISGRVLYADGEPVIGARMQIFVKKDGRFMPHFSSVDSSITSVTDDRGYYRFSALPSNDYFILVIESSIQSNGSNLVRGYNTNSFNNDSQLKIFYPNVGEITEAQPISTFPGQEQSDMNLTIPDRRLFTVSGLVVAKNNNLPLKNMRVSFQKISENLGFGFGSTQASQAATDKQGNWTLVDLPAGKYRLTATPNTRNVIYNGQSQPVDNQPKYAPITKEIEIENENLTGILFELSEQATISGKVFLEDGKAFSDPVFLGAFDEEKKINSSAFIRNQVNGNNQAQKPTNEFRIEGLSAGNFQLTASINGGKYFVKSITLNNKDVKDSPFELKDGENIEGVRVILSSDVGTVKGRINNFENKGRTFVVLIPTGKSPMLALRSSGGQTVPKANGEFELNSAPGEYYTIVGTDTNRPKSESDYKEWFDNLVKNAPKITVTAKETVNLNLDYPK